MAKQFNIETKLQKVIIFLYRDKKSFYSLYNHKFNYIDFIKLNSAI